MILEGILDVSTCILLPCRRIQKSETTQSSLAFCQASQIRVADLLCTACTIADLAVKA